MQADFILDKINFIKFYVNVVKIVVEAALVKWRQLMSMISLNGDKI